MRLTDAERAENREALQQMSLPEKLGFVFDYYKFPLVLALIAAVALGSVAYYRLTRREALLYVACANVAFGDDLDAALNGGFVEALGENPRRSEVTLLHGLYLSRDANTANHEYAYASQFKVMAAMANGQLDIMLMNREACDLMSSGGYLLPLEEALWPSGALYARVQASLVENTVILEDNDIEHRLDESIPYRATTEAAVNAIRISDFPLFQRADFSGEVYLGIVGNSARLDRALEYIDYLTSA